MAATQTTHWTQYMITASQVALLPCVELQLSYAAYQEIQKAEQFNLKTALRVKAEGTFEPELALSLKMILSPDLWEQREEDLEAQIKRLTEIETDAALLDPDNWMVLSVRQSRTEKEIAYRTFWDYVNWEAIQNDRPQEEEIFAAFGRFAQATGLSTSAIQDAIQPANIGETIMQSFQETLDELFSPHGNSLLTQAVSDASLFKQLVQFLVEEDWGFSRVSGEEELHIQFNGEHAQWMLVVRVLPESQQILCYSYYPQAITETQRPLLVEYITRANHNMILGNFELNWQNGELRYKTSLDANGIQVNATVFKQLIFTNVSLMDQYIGGIEAVTSGTKLPEAAILEIESED